MAVGDRHMPNSFAAAEDGPEDVHLEDAPDAAGGEISYAERRGDDRRVCD